MKAIIAGGRDSTIREEGKVWLDDIIDSLGVDEIVHGGATGIDAKAHDYAIARKIPVRVVPAAWTKHGKAAGPFRNRIMAEYADICILFHGGKGTASMKKEAKRAGLQIFEREEE